MKKFLLAVVMVCALVLPGRASELEQAMESLGRSFKPLAAMAKSGKIDFKKAAGQADKCLAAAEKASKIVPKAADKEADPAAARKAYADAQAQLQKDFQNLKTAISAQDEAAFKTAVESLIAARKKGHDRFKKD